MFIYRMIDDFDHKEGHFWLPKSSDVPQVFGDRGFATKLKKVYDLIWDPLPSNLKQTFRSTMYYGNARHELKIAQGDGISLAFGFLTHFTKMSELTTERNFEYYLRRDT